MLIRILNTLPSRIWNMVFFLFSDYSKSTVGENGDFPHKCCVGGNEEKSKKSLHIQQFKCQSFRIQFPRKS
ncbi:hypothetical protein [Anaerobutyricum soehngenii]|uniref:hypothetical protein n=1 Tax=Anaerobutyricum soehngenii TaxID=105843 RepID=UPI0032C05102